MRKFSQYVMEMEGAVGTPAAPGAQQQQMNPVQVLQGLANSNPQVKAALAALTPEMLQQLAQPANQVQQAPPAVGGAGQ